MKKIEWDLVNGVIEVLDFDNKTEIVDNFEIDDLQDEFYGVRGAEISEDMFSEIEKEYGIQ